MKIKTLWYFARGTQVLVTLAGDDFLADPTIADAELTLCWHPDAVKILVMDTWGKIGVVAVKTTLKKLRAMGGIYERGANYVEYIERNAT